MHLGKEIYIEVEGYIMKFNYHWFVIILRFK